MHKLIPKDRKLQMPASPEMFRVWCQVCVNDDEMPEEVPPANFIQVHSVAIGHAGSNLILLNLFEETKRLAVR